MQPLAAIEACNVSISRGFTDLVDRCNGPRDVAVTAAEEEIEHRVDHGASICQAQVQSRHTDPVVPTVPLYAVEYSGVIGWYQWGVRTD